MFIFEMVTVMTSYLKLNRPGSRSHAGSWRTAFLQTQRDEVTSLKNSRNVWKIWLCGLITVDFEALCCRTDPRGGIGGSCVIMCEPRHHCSTSVTHVQNDCTASLRGNLLNTSWKMTPWWNAVQMWGWRNSLFYTMLDSSLRWPL